eukprot:276348-Prymnesium_polylepis.1
MVSTSPQAGSSWPMDSFDAPHVLRRTLVTVMLSDRDVASELPSIRTTWLDRLPHVLLLADSDNATVGVQNCCASPQLGREFKAAQQKLEHAFARALAHEQQAHRAFLWFVFTETDVWWNTHSLAALLLQRHGLAATSAPHGVVTGGGTP